MLAETKQSQTTGSKPNDVGVRVVFSLVVGVLPPIHNPERKPQPASSDNFDFDLLHLLVFNSAGGVLFPLLFLPSLLHKQNQPFGNITSTRVALRSI